MNRRVRYMMETCPEGDHYPAAFRAICIKQSSAISHICSTDYTRPFVILQTLTSQVSRVVISASLKQNVNWPRVQPGSLLYVKLPTLR